MFLTPYILAFVLMAGFSSSASSVVPSIGHTQAPKENLFMEYMTRGLHSCAGNYLQTLTKLHHLIKEAAAEHRKCAESLAQAEKNYGPTDYAHLDELLDQYRDADEKQTVNAQRRRRSTALEMPL
ncbi:hypothetical protein L596_012340 [Steinernema carpocapsae]|uniref:Uncharacterized protein n=1 Tax=Steinernema carpocapsae TaxID=34508 RepID=A0A4U5NWS8_STECR|nr:hypothetical protein L596_012340 [Steinernema carpocapsae]